MDNEDSPPLSPNIEEDMDEDERFYSPEFVDFMDVLDNEEEPDGADIVFEKHTRSVFCGSLSNDGKLAATGGEDDMAYLWDTANGEVLLRCVGHKDSIIFAEFNRCNTYLATGDMKGIIQVWQMSDKQLVWDMAIDDVTCMRWHKQKNILFAGDQDGGIYMWKIPTGDCQMFPGNGRRAETVTVTPDETKLVVGYEDGGIGVIDLKEWKIHVKIPSNSAHSGLITDIDCQFDSKLIVSAGADGKVVLSTISTGKIVAVLQNLQENESKSTEEGASDDTKQKENWAEAVAFCKDPELHLVAAATVNGEIFIWDISKHILRHKIQQNGGISKLLWKGTSPILFSAGLDGVLRCYDARTAELLKSFCGHDEDILDMFISEDGLKILTTSDDSTARIFDISEF